MSTKFPCVASVVESFSSDLLRAILNYFAELFRIYNTVEHLQWSFSAKTAKGLKTLTIFAKKQTQITLLTSGCRLNIETSL